VTVVSPAWLELREPADAAARSAELAGLAAALLPARPLVIHDLGGGSGSMGRWLAPRLPQPQHWVIHDRDETLLALAEAGPPPGATVEARRTELGCLTAADLRGADLVVASALLDILTADELAAVLRAGRGRPMLLALTVAGRVALTPADPIDAAMTAAFNDHQRRDGRLGPDAAGALGAAVVRPSPWRLGAAHAALTAEWLEGWVGAATEQEPSPAGDYLDRRLEQLAAGELEVVVEHADALVLP
jgi:hypothetical protein